MLLIAMLLAAAGPQTQIEMTRDAGRAYAAADAALNTQWKATYAAMKALDAQDMSRGGGFGYAPALLASQRAWLKFRDTQCAIEGGEFAGGSLQPMVIAQCKARLTDERTKQLKSLLWNR